jgi:formylglycine-generating enzyme required for sulfatase activity
MKVQILWLIVFLAAFVLLGLARRTGEAPAFAAQAQKPLTQDEILGLVKFGMDSATLAQRIQERGVDFEPTEDYVNSLKSAGAQDVVVQAVIRTSALGQESGPPLTHDRVMRLVRLGMNGAELAARIKGRGLDFEPSDADLEALRRAGAQEVVIRAIREVKPQPLTRDQVGKLVAGGVPSERAAMLVKQRGIDFVADEQYLDMLRLAGGDDALIAGVREASRSVTAQLAVQTSPGAEVFLNGTLQGNADPQGTFTVRAKPGAYALKVSLKGKLDFERTVTLTPPQPTKVEARLESPPPEVRVNPKDGLKYVWIPPGTFMMGCSPGDNECGDDERPAHQVTITRGFWMGQTPVTVGAYRRFCGATRHQMPRAPNFNNGWANENMPIVNVIWDDAQAYCGWMGGRLPTEAEWEYAGRAGSTDSRYGNMDDIAWYIGNSGNETHDVAQKRPNGFGLYDMLGNVWQWVNDWDDWNYYHNSPSQDPSGPSAGRHRVLRGGSWDGYPGIVRVSDRGSHGPAWDDYGGFRCRGEAASP